MHCPVVIHTLRASLMRDRMLVGAVVGGGLYGGCFFKEGLKLGNLEAETVRVGLTN